jgi:hypothetical protein
VIQLYLLGPVFGVLLALLAHPWFYEDMVPTYWPYMGG